MMVGQLGIEPRSTDYESAALTIKLQALHCNYTRHVDLRGKAGDYEKYAPSPLCYFSEAYGLFVRPEWAVFGLSLHSDYTR